MLTNKSCQLVINSDRAAQPPVISHGPGDEGGAAAGLLTCVLDTQTWKQASCIIAVLMLFSRPATRYIHPANIFLHPDIFIQSNYSQLGDTLEMVPVITFRFLEVVHFISVIILPLVAAGLSHE